MSRSDGLECGKYRKRAEKFFPLAYYGGMCYNLVTEEIPAVFVMVRDFEPQRFIRDGASVPAMSGPLV